MVGKLVLKYEAWLNRRRLQLLEDFTAGAATENGVSLVDAAIYRLPRSHERTVRLTAPGGRVILSRKRRFWEVGPFSPRFYVLDSMPGRMFEKLSVVALFAGVGIKPAIAELLRTTFYVNERPFPYQCPGLLERWVVRGRVPDSLYQEQSVPRQPPSREEGGRQPIDGPFPADDVPNPTGDTPPQGTPAVRTPTLLFYGLCFQNPLVMPPYNPDDVGGMKLTTDGLWQGVCNVAAAFGNRGYSTAVGLAGHPDPMEQYVATWKAQTFAEMLMRFRQDLETHTEYCRSAIDQLVIYVAAHGFGSQVRENPTGDVALLFNPFKDTLEWVTHAQLLTGLAAIPAIANAPTKVYFMLLSCRGGRIFEGGVFPTSLKGMHIISAAADSSSSPDVRRFPRAIVDALSGDKRFNWTQFITGLKQQMASQGDKFPRNQDVSDCGVQVALKRIRHTDRVYGDNWVIRFDMGHQKTDLLETIPPLREIDYSPRFKVLHQERIWAKCNAPARIPYHLSISLSGQADIRGDVAGELDFSCTRGQVSRTVRVRAATSPTAARGATLEFELELFTNCY